MNELIVHILYDNFSSKSNQNFNHPDDLILTAKAIKTLVNNSLPQ